MAESMHNLIIDSEVLLNKLKRLRRNIGNI
jgi:hypothetical protein